MALRFLLIASADRERRVELEAKLSQHVALQPVFRGSLFVIMLPVGESVLELPNHGGAVIGRIFHRHGSAAAVDKLDGVAGGAIHASGGQELIDRYWGEYIAVIETPSALRVLRAPLGNLPCYYIQADGVTVFASDPDLLSETGLFTPKIDWSGAVRYLYARDLPSETTSLEGLTELLPGNLVDVQDGVSRTRECWSPWDFVREDSRRSRDPLEEQFKRVTQHCARAWASSYDRLLLGVSGGLDSSIIAASLGSSSDLSCITLVTHGPDGDEREYARTIAHAISADLREEFYTLRDVDIRQSVVSHRPRPCGRSHELSFHASVLKAAQEARAGAFVTGNGGDNVLYNTQSARPIADRFLVEGLGSGLLKTIQDICTLTGCSAVQAIREALRVLRQSGRAYIWKPDTLFLHRDIVDAQTAERLSHPWLEAPKDALPGKAAHVGMILRMQHHLEGYDRHWGLPVLNPLASQPLVELCLSIPTWEMCIGGMNRAVARAAFSDVLPPALIARRTKGGPDSFALQVIDQNLGEVRDRLLGGNLARRGILDLKHLEMTLHQGRFHGDAAYLRVLSLLDTEAWIDHWNTRHLTAVRLADSSLEPT